MVYRGFRAGRVGMFVTASLVVAAVALVALPFESFGSGSGPPSASAISRSGSEGWAATVGHTARSVGAAASLGLPAFSEASAGNVVRTIFPDYNASVAGNFPWSVLGWQVGTPAYVPSTGDVWLPVRATSAHNLPPPGFAPAIVFSTATDQFLGFLPWLQNTSAFLYDPVNGLLYSADYVNDTVGVLNPDTGLWEHASLPVGLNPVALALNRSANQIYVANHGSNNVTIVNANTNSVSNPGIATGQSPVGLAFDPRNQLLFVADGGDASVTPLNTTTTATGPSVSMPGIPCADAFSSYSGLLAVTIPSDNSVALVNAGSGVIKGFQTIGTGGGPVVTSANATEFVIGNSSGSNIVVINASSGSVVDSRITVDGNVTALATESTGPTIFAWGSVTRNLTEVSLATNMPTESTPTLAPEPASIAYDSMTNRVFVADVFGHSVIVVNGTSGATEGSPLNFGSPALSVAVDANTSRLYVGLLNGVDEVNPATGDVVATNAVLTGGNDLVVVDPQDGLLWVANVPSGLEALNLTTLALAFTVGIPTGEYSQNTIALDSAAHELFVVNQSSGSVEAVNATNGHIDDAGIASGAGTIALAFDAADDSLYVAGTNLTIIDPNTRTLVGSPIPLSSHSVTTGIVYDSAREDLYVTTAQGAPAYASTVTVIDGSSRSASYGSSLTMPVGELAQDPTSFYLAGAEPPSTTVVWVPNSESGTISEIATPPEVTLLAASPSGIDVGQSTQILLGYEGGAGPDSISYSGLPSGCASADQATISCSPTVSGNFSITATVTDSLGFTASATTSLSVGSSLSLKLVLTPGPSPELDVGQNLSGVATAVGGTPGYSFYWIFGDGETAEGSAVTHQYHTVGTFLLSVAVDDSVQENTTESRLVVVNSLPTVSAAATPTNATDVNVALEFSATVSGGTGSGIGTWDFTGSTAERVTPSGNVYSTTHAWPAAGTYSAVFTYTDAANVTVRQSISVTVEPALSATFSWSPGVEGTSLVAGSKVDFLATVTGGLAPFDVTWSFGDGSYGYGLAPTHAYAEAGSYSVRVVLTDSAGVEVNATLTIPVGAASSPGSSSATATFGLSLFLGILLGGTAAAIVLFAVGRPKRKGPPPPRMYVPPEGSR